MIAVKKKSKIDPFEIGEIVIETGILDRKKRVFGVFKKSRFRFFGKWGSLGFPMAF